MDPASRPLTMLPREIVAMQVMARKMVAKVSTGPNLSATAASWGAAKIRTMVENSPPKVEATSENPRAREASPRTAIG